MSEHAFVHDNLAAYVAGGLDAAEGERVETHAAGCEACAAALRDARAFDHDLDALFVGTRPSPALEDRLIKVFRASSRPRRFSPWHRKLAWGAAAAIGLGATGAGMSYFAGLDSLPFPGMERVDQAVAQNKPTNPETIFYTEPSKVVSVYDNSQSMDRLKDERPDRTATYNYFPPAQGAFPNDTNGIVWSDGQATDGASNSVMFSKQAPDSTMGAAWSYDRAGAPGGGSLGMMGGQGMMGGGFGFGRGGFGGGIGGMMGGGPGMMGRAPMGGGGGMRPGGGPQQGQHPPSSSTSKPEDGRSQAKDGEAKEVREQEGEKKVPPTAPAASTPPPVQVDSFVPDAHRDKLELKADGKMGDNKSGKEDKDREESRKNDGQAKGQDKGDQQSSKPQDDADGSKGTGPGQVDPKKVQPPAEQPAARKVIRSGDIEFEVPSFDSAAAAVTKLVTNVKGAFVATVNSDKLPNGKVKGSLVVRVPPEQLDGLVLDLRRELGKDGELKGLRLASQDITKQYYDIESRLKAAKTMQERLLQIIKEGKGEIKQLLEAEKELGVWRTKIEEFEGEIRYYNSVVALSTLTVVLAEKSISSAVDIVEREIVQAGVEVDDVDKAREQVLTAVAEAKGRVTKAEMKQFAAGQFNANLLFEVPPGAGGPLRDRLRQIGTVMRLEIDRVQQAEGGQATRDAKVRRGDTLFNLSLYNVANITARETTTATLAVADVPAAYRSLEGTVVKVKGRIVDGRLNEQDRNSVTADLTFEVRRADEAAIQAALAAAGEIVSRNVSRAAVADNATNFTDAKVRFQVSLKDVSTLNARETTTLTFAVSDVQGAYKTLHDAVTLAKGRILQAQLNEQDRNNVTAQLDFEVRRADEAAIQAAMAAAEVLARTVGRAEPGQNVTDSRVKYRVGIGNVNQIRPREGFALRIEVTDVEQTAAVFAAQVKDAAGRIVSADTKQEPAGQVKARLLYAVPLAAAPALVEQLKKSGTVRAQETRRDPQAPDGKLAVAQIAVELESAESIVAKDSGVWPQVRNGLSTSAKVLLFSLSWIIFGALVVLPWALVGYGVYRLGRRMLAPPLPATSTAVPATPPA
jgi:hypothetical protein